MAAPERLSPHASSRPLTEESPPELGPRGLLPSLLPFFSSSVPLFFGNHIFSMSGTSRLRLSLPVSPLLATQHQRTAPAFGEESRADAEYSLRMNV